MRNIFSDKATLILRMMLRNPEKKWVVRDFMGKDGVSLGLSQNILEAMAKKGYVERIKKGPVSHTILVDKDGLIDDWLKWYGFERNIVNSYYSANKKILNKAKDVLKGRQYALALHTAANLMTSYVKAEDVYIYLKSANWDKELLDLRQRLDLKELARGGNFHIIQPYYKNSIFFNSQTIKGFTVVSNLQLYLDLYNFQPRGKEHAQYLKHLLKERGKILD